MNRRSMLGMLGIGAAAGPAMAESFVQQNATPPIPMSDYGEYKVATKASLIEENPIKRLANLRKEYDVLTKDRDTWISDYIKRDMSEYIDGYSNIDINRIDPDIRAMRSISESSKIRMYLHRKANRRYNSIVSNILGDIERLVGKIT